MNLEFVYDYSNAINRLAGEYKTGGSLRIGE